MPAEHREVQARTAVRIASSTSDHSPGLANDVRGERLDPLRPRADRECQRRPLREPDREAAGDAEHAERRDERRQVQPRDEQPVRQPAQPADQHARARPRRGSSPAPVPTRRTAPV